MKNTLKIGITGLLIVGTLAFFNQAWASVVLIDSYPSSNGGVQGGFSTSIRAQLFVNSSSIILDSAQFYFYSSTVRTGTLNAYVYNYTGTPGTNAVPTGSPIATSDNVDASTLNTSTPSAVNFTFSGANRITLLATTDYFIAVKATGLSGSIVIWLGSATPSDGGNGAYFNGSWSSTVGTNVVSYVYGDNGGGTPVIVSGSGQKMLMGSVW